MTSKWSVGSDSPGISLLRVACVQAIYVSEQAQQICVELSRQQSSQAIVVPEGAAARRGL